MTSISWILLVHFDELPCLVVNLLIKSHRHLIGVNFFHISGFPALTAQQIQQ